MTRYTIIVDASENTKQNIVGIGLVVHKANEPGRNGIVVDEILETYRGIAPRLAEMLAVFRALEIAAERGFRVVKVRSDYNYMRRQLKQAHERNRGRDDGNGMQGRILRLASTFEEVKFAYQPRRKNHRAHTLARRAVVEMSPVTRSDLFTQ